MSARLSVYYVDVGSDYQALDQIVEDVEWAYWEAAGRPADTFEAWKKSQEQAGDCRAEELDTLSRCELPAGHTGHHQMMVRWDG